VKFKGGSAMDEQARALARGTTRAIWGRQKDLAEAINSTELKISQIFNGRREPTEEEKVKLSEALGLPKKLFDDGGEEKR
jgi:transcriptional regulator with XRE-family HTH domain